MRLVFLGVVTFVLVGCSTFSKYPGYYTVKAYDKNGNRLDQITQITEGSSVYRMINANCLAFPGAKIVIKNAKSQQELSELSPHQCGGKSSKDAT